jgi:tRNA(Ile)-lysidine synthase
MSLIKKVQNTIFQYSLFKKGDGIILAVSGGPDSVCLLDIFSKLKKKYSLKLIIAHVNYGLRGRDSKRDEKLVRDLAEKYGLEIFVLHPVETHCNASLRRDKNNFPENTLRDIRYDFFEQTRKKYNFDHIAVAHNLDDQAETFLMRVLRGSGIRGLSAMKYKNNKIIRPLLNVPRVDIIDYLKKNKLAWREDKTNFETKFTRNKIRNGLIPYLEKNFNPDIKKTIFNSLESIVDDLDFLETAARKAHQKNKALSVRKILTLHPAVQKRLILASIEKEKTDLKNIDASHVKEILKIAKSTKNKRQVVVLKGLIIKRSGDTIQINKA